MDGVICLRVIIIVIGPTQEEGDTILSGVGIDINSVLATIPQNSNFHGPQNTGSIYLR